MHVFADQTEGFRSGEGDVAAYLRLNDLLRPEAEGGGVQVASLLFEGVPADGPAVQARGRAGLEPAGAKAQRAQGFAEENTGRLAAAAGGIALLAAVDEAVEEGSGGDDGGAGQQAAAVAEFEAQHTTAGTDRTGQCVGVFEGRGRLRRGFFDHEVNDLGLADVQAGLRLQHLAHLDAVKLLVTLGARTPNRRPPRSIQQPELNANGIGHLAHDAAQGVDLAHQVPLGHAADGWIAAHLGDQVEVHGDERGLEAHARGGHGGLAAGVTGADHDHIVLFGECHLDGESTYKAILRILWHRR